jgi:signal transduction histidine kinase/ligand-binding sensor domain-containing protein
MLIASALTAQPSFKKTRYSKEQGLSHNTVLGMEMDDRGFLWIATLDGLNRFDGLEMKIYRPNEADSLSLTDGFIHGIHQHANGNLWVSTRDGGLNIYDPATETFRSLDNENAEYSNFPSRQISLLYQDQNENYWIAFFGHTSGILDPESGRYLPANIVDEKTNEKKTSSNAFLEFADGSMLMTSFNGLFYLSAEEVKKFVSNPRSDQKILAVSVPYSKDEPFPNTVNMKVDSNGDLWVNKVSTGIEKMKKSNIPEFLKESIKTGVVRNSAGRIVVEREGYLISGYLSNQLLFANLDTGKKTISKLDESINIRGATYLFEDKNKELWVYTWGGGFYKLEQKKGIKLVNNTTNPASFESDFMLGFEEDSGGFWISSGAGVLWRDFQTESISSLNNRLSNTKIGGVWGFERDETGLWMATVEKGLAFISSEELQKENGIKPLRFNNDNSLIKSKNLHEVFRDSRGWLWLGYEGEGIQILKNPEALISGEVLDVEELTTEAKSEGLSISSSYIRKFYEDSFGDVWVATNNRGFDKIEIENKQIVEIRSFKKEMGNEASIPHNDGRSIYQQNDSTFWFATYGGGIAKWNSVEDIITRYTTEDGLPNNSTYSVVGETDKRYIWTSTNSGLARLDTKTNTFDVFTEEDGLQNNEFNTGAYMHLTDGRLVFGGINGLNIIAPDELAKNERIPPVYITEIQLFDEPLEMDSSATAVRNIELAYDQNFLSFGFAALDLESPKQNLFAYKMEGVDADWVYSGNRNFAGYPNLSPGNYVFRVKAANNDGLWNEAGTSLNIKITPPWWQTVWFRIISGLLFLTVVIVGVRYLSQRRLREQIRKMEIDNKLRNERERISRDLHDHVGSQLANIMSGLSLVDKYNEIDNKEKSSSLMDSLRDDAEVTIKELRETIWALNQNSLSLDAFKDHLHNYFKNQTAFSESLQMNYSVSDEKGTILSSTQALNLFRIIQEASQNTLKYANAENIYIALCRKNGFLKVLIKDDGEFKGHKTSFNGGYGFGNMKKRTEELGGEISVDVKSGTEISLKIPL